MYYFLTAIITAIAVWLTMCADYKCFIVKMSKESKPFEAFGTNYFFMTQDQIQKAVKAIYLLEKKSAEFQELLSPSLDKFKRENGTNEI